MVLKIEVYTSTCAKCKMLDVVVRTAIQEMDIDTVLSRRPQIALVDELAHTNAPGSRHEKRWQDVEE
ncbi:MAG: hypothetical protein ABR986_11435, partial [Methanomassiliicoccales archaeon]